MTTTPTSTFAVISRSFDPPTRWVEYTCSGTAATFLTRRTRWRLVVLHPGSPFERGDTSPAVETAQTILDERRGGRRINRNMVVFLAAEKARVPELRQAIRSRLAWQSILDERGEHDLNLTPADANQARTRLEEADHTVELRIGETFSQVLYPVQAPGQAEIRWSSVRVTGSDGLFERVVRKLESSQHLITSYAGTLVRRDLDRPDAPLWDGDHIAIRTLWSYYCRYLYMERLAGFGVLAAAISKGVASTNWQNDTFAYAESYDSEADRYPGLLKAQHVDVTQSLAAVLVDPERALVQIDAESRLAETEDEVPGEIEDTWKPKDPGPGRPPAPKPTRFYGRMELDLVRAMRDLGGIIDEVTKHLSGTGNEVTLTVEINARSGGYDTRTQRIVKENATQLGFESHEFEA